MSTYTPQQWHCLASLFELLSLPCLHTSPDLGQALASGEFAAAAGELADACGLPEDARRHAVKLLDGYRGKDADACFHEVRQEYTRLFVSKGKPKVTPYIGVWDAERRGVHPLLFVSTECVAIEHFMRNRGVAKHGSNDPVDHIGSVLEFMEYLCLVNAGAVQVPEGFAVEEGDFDAFFTDHFAGYAAFFSAEIRRLSENACFLATADLLDGLLAIR